MIEETLIETGLEDEVLGRIVLEKALAILTKEERDVLTLYYYEGYTLEETAKKVAAKYRGGEGNLTRTGVRYIRDRALNKVKEYVNA